MTWIERATRDEIVDEMRRKPDAEILLEWIRAREGHPDVVNGEVKDAIDAYWAAQGG